MKEVARNIIIIKGQSPRERRKSEPVVLYRNSNQRFPERFNQVTYSKECFNDKVNPSSNFGKQEVAPSAREEIEPLEEDDSCKWHNEDAPLPPLQLMRRRWSIERINSYDFGPCTNVKTGSTSFRAETLCKEHLAPSASDDRGGAHINKIQKVGYIDGSKRGRRPDVVQVDNQNFLPFTTSDSDTGVSSSCRPLGTGKIHRKEKERDRGNKGQDISNASERKEKVGENEEIVGLGKTDKEKPCIVLNQRGNSSWGNSRTTAKELLQKYYQGSDDDSYSDDEDQKEVRIIMKNVKLRGILKKTRRAEVKNVTFSRKVKMKIVYYL